MTDHYAPVAGLYDVAYGDFEDDIYFYQNLAYSAEGPLLELGVGTARVALPLAEAGFEVTGIDNSAAMIAIAENKLKARGKIKGSLELVQGDMTDFAFERRFGMVFVAADTFQHLLTTEQQDACMACASASLAKGGYFALSMRSPASVSWDEADGWAPLLLHWTRSDPETGETLMKLCAEQPDAARMVRRLTYVYDRVRADGELRRSVFETELRYSTEAEIRLLLQHHGLRVTHVYGDYDLSPVGLGENLVFVSRAEDSR